MSIRGIIFVITVVVIMFVAIALTACGPRPEPEVKFDTSAAKERIRVYNECVGSNVDNDKVRDHCNQMVNKN